jgi:hypothetical protein
LRKLFSNRFLRFEGDRAHLVTLPSLPCAGLYLDLNSGIASNIWYSPSARSGLTTKVTGSPSNVSIVTREGLIVSKNGRL